MRDITKDGRIYILVLLNFKMINSHIAEIRINKKEMSLFAWMLLKDVVNDDKLELRRS